MKDMATSSGGHHLSHSGEATQSWPDNGEDHQMELVPSYRLSLQGVRGKHVGCARTEKEQA